MTSRAWFSLLVVAVALERLAELRRSQRNASWAFARGGVESGRGHYPWMALLHGGLLAGCLGEVWLLDRPFLPWLGWPMLALALVAQALRWWCISTLGPRWNTRVIVVPGLPLVRRGPYRLFAHPNYVAVVAEGVALPMVHTAWLTAAGFSVLNAAVLRVRVRAETAALRQAAGPG
jgi:methyltransferase